jgi:hypothetical protein
MIENKVWYKFRSDLIIDIDYLNNIFIINENRTMHRGRWSNVTFQTRKDTVILDNHKIDITEFNKYLGFHMARIIHSAGIIKISYFHKPQIFASIAHRLLYGDGPIYECDQIAYSKINQLNLTSLIEKYPIYTKDLLNHLNKWFQYSPNHQIILKDYNFKVQIVLEYDQTMIQSYMSFTTNLFDMDNTQEQIEYALNDSYHKYNTHVGNLNKIVVNIITPLK